MAEHRAGATFARPALVEDRRVLPGHPGGRRGDRYLSSARVRDARGKGACSQRRCDPDAEPGELKVSGQIRTLLLLSKRTFLSLRQLRLIVITVIGPMLPN